MDDISMNITGTKCFVITLSFILSACCYTDVETCLVDAENIKAQCIRQCLYDADDPAICETIQPSCSEQAEEVLDKCLETNTACYDLDGWW